MLAFDDIMLVKECVLKVEVYTLEVKALWWPGKQHYVKYHPEFSFQEMINNRLQEFALFALW